MMRGLGRAFLLAAIATAVALATMAVDAGRELIKFVYFVPKDIEFDHRVYTTLQKKAWHFAQWNRGQFNGRAPDYAVEYIHGDHPWEWYVYDVDEYNKAENKTAQWWPYLAMRQVLREAKGKVGGNATSDFTKDPNVIVDITLHEHAPPLEVMSTVSAGERYAFFDVEDVQSAYVYSPSQHLGMAYWFGYLWGATYEQGPSCMGTGYLLEHCDYTNETRALILQKNGRFFDGHTGRMISVRPPPPVDLKIWRFMW